MIVRGDRVAAAGEARAARAAFASLGAAHESARAGRLEAEIQGGRDPSGVPLSDREVDVLRLVAAGRSNEEIAGDLVLSIRTVERHISNIYSKIGASGRTARVAASGYAHRHGLT
ncbi:MAG: helix-turn-helix transcriptional regulator [Chloroflexi bacterium]|nr:helix-turn-helix transcriptional regulator [Chloroflexota bacterium]